MYLPIKCVVMRLESGNEQSEMVIDYSYLLVSTAVSASVWAGGGAGWVRDSRSRILGSVAYCFR